MGEIMTGFETLTSEVIPLAVENVDTDQIIPARFLKTTDKHGLGAVLFCDWRYLGEVPTLGAAEAAESRSDFPLNLPRYQSARVLLAGDNFGCGSSREHAPWALVGWGLQAVISTSFADIFKSNALKNSLLPVEVDPETHTEMFEMADSDGGLVVTIDLRARSLSFEDGRSIEFPIDAFARRCLIEGVDQLGYLLSHEQSIADFELRRAGGGV